MKAWEQTVKGGPDWLHLTLKGFLVSSLCSGSDPGPRRALQIKNKREKILQAAREMLRGEQSPPQRWPRCDLPPVIWSSGGVDSARPPAAGVH